MFCRAASRARLLSYALNQASVSRAALGRIQLMSGTKRGSQPVQHDKENKSFLIPLEQSDKKAVLHYTLPRDNIMDLQSTLVPEEARGHGLAAQLVGSALDYAADNNLKVKLTCSYTAEYVEKNQEKIQNSEKLKDLKFV